MKITICMCTYNGEEYLKEQFDSIMNQTVRPNEIVVYDDASTDKTTEIIQNYKEQNADIVWKIVINEKNIGWRTNFKNCINEATGDIIFLSDQDDIWKDDKLEIMSKVLEENDKIKLLVSDYQAFYMEGAAEHHLNTHSTNTQKVVLIKPNEKFMYCARPGCTFAFKREVIEDFNLCWHESFAHDALLWRMACLKKQLYRIDYISILFRRHRHTASSDRTAKISKQAKINEIYTILMYKKCCDCLGKLSLDTKSRAILSQADKWLFRRMQLYKKPSIFKVFRLFRYRKFYYSLKSYAKEINAMIKIKKVKKEQKK